MLTAQTPRMSLQRQWAQRLSCRAPVLHLKTILLLNITNLMMQSLVLGLTALSWN